MFVSAVYVRFFRSFNFDYLRKAHDGYVADPWDVVEPEGSHYPYVCVPLEPSVTTVVGANESGKSQLLSAIKHALAGTGMAPGDFCRYSQFFVIDQAMAYPDLGLELRDLSDDERAAMCAACKVDAQLAWDRVVMFRVNGADPVVYLRHVDRWESYPVTDQAALDKILPRAFEIDAHVALPQSVPIRYLAQPGGALISGSRLQRVSFVNQILDNGPSWFATPEKLTAAAPSLLSAYATASATAETHRKQLQLADDLLLKVAGIDRTAFVELRRAVESGEDGYANGIVQRMNGKLAAALNFPKWWSQDRQFELLLTLRDQDLVFTIRDRTGTEYSADERSGGLKYFLSYFIQYLAHESPESGISEIPEILLMDEPDAYLSSAGQQDLLRIFEDFAYPQNPARRPCQVVYVTHSPFLIDKNHGERLRVLEKGEADEGTRVVRNVARNHYEPLRSAFGSFVAETTFISNCNLMLEGASDQVLLAGMSARLRRQRTSTIDNLDLNTVTLVPAGSAKQIPYLVYLARGRDVDRPALVVLLDGDKEADDAVKLLKKGPNGQPAIDARFILQLSDLPAEDVVSTRTGTVTAIEDLIPVEVGIAAMKHYAKEFLEPHEASAIGTVTADDVSPDKAPSTHAALERAGKAKLPAFHLDKVGFARSVLDVLRDEDSFPEAAATLDQNFRALFRQLTRLQREAMKDIATEKIGSKVRRLTRLFLRDHPAAATREQAAVLMEEIDASLDNSLESEDLKARTRDVRRRFRLDEEPTAQVEDLGAFRSILETLVYGAVIKVQDDASPNRDDGEKATADAKSSSARRGG